VTTPKTDTAVTYDGEPDPEVAVEVLLAGHRYDEALPYLAAIVDGTSCYLARTLLTRAEALVSLERFPDRPAPAEGQAPLRRPGQPGLAARADGPVRGVARGERARPRLRPCRREGRVPAPAQPGPRAVAPRAARGSLGRLRPGARPRAR
jgi:hypothetical protein